MFSVTVRDHVMIAHSLNGEVFGPAQRLHGATYVVDVEFRRSELDVNGIVVDIGRAGETLREVLSPFAYRNLDELEQFAGRNSTTEALAKAIFDAMAARIRDGDFGPSADGIESLRVVLKESHVAWAAYEHSLSRG